MTSIVSFATSLILMLALIFLRRIEINRGGRYLPGLRERLDNVTVKFLNTFVYHLPQKIAQLLRHVTIVLVDFLIGFLLRIVRWLEQKLDRFVHSVKGKKKLNGNGNSSGYLKDVAEHKEEIRQSIPENYPHN